MLIVLKDIIIDSEYVDIVELMLFRISLYFILLLVLNELLVGVWKLIVIYGRGWKVRKEVCRIKKK